jgi:hypothetical protein
MHVLHFSYRDLLEMDFEELAGWWAEALRVLGEVNGIRS